MRIIYASGNKEKINQVKSFVKTMNYNYEFIGLKEIRFNDEIIENGSTFEENSLIKAKAVKKFCDRNNIREMIVADDAGLCVDALGGEPGIYSARYAGDHASQEITLKKLLDNMKDIKEEDRTAIFVCVLTAILPNGEIMTLRGETKGKIALKPGTMGKLTYGPVFIPQGFNKVMNELSDEELGTTHREKAFLELFSKIENLNNI